MFPSTRARIATEVVGPIGGADALPARADAFATGDAPDQQLALHLVDHVIFNEGEGVAEAHRRKADLLELHAAGEGSFVAHNVLKSAAAIEREALTSRRLVASGPRPNPRSTCEVVTVEHA